VQAPERAEAWERHVREAETGLPVPGQGGVPRAEFDPAQRTASAACWSDRPSTNCSTQTMASWAGERPGRPSRGYQPAKSSSCHSPSNRSRTHIAVVPSGLLARAICAVRDGTAHRNGNGGTTHTPTAASACGTASSMPVDHAAAPRDSKIPNRIKLRRWGTGAGDGRAGGGPAPAEAEHEAAAEGAHRLFPDVSRGLVQSPRRALLAILPRPPVLGLQLLPTGEPSGAASIERPGRECDPGSGVSPWPRACGPSSTFADLGQPHGPRRAP
jgi:hypothetical protein